MRDQALPILLTVVTAAALVAVLLGEIALLNRLAGAGISISIRWYDVLVGMTIYLKTSVDFAIFIARVMERNPGWRSRIAIEIGTAAGNAAGTFAILAVWVLFHQVAWLLGIMIVIASLVLLRLAEDGMEHAKDAVAGYRAALRRPIQGATGVLSRINGWFDPVLGRLVPSMNAEGKERLSFWPLIVFSFTVPFVLGLDDFAGYVPLFSVVNVVGFATGVFLGHMILNVVLYLSPKRTVAVVTQPLISLLGSAAFVGLALWGLIEAGRLLAEYL